jgi:hypothetical protein
MHTHHATALTKHEADIAKLKAAVGSLDRRMILIRKDVLAVVSDLQTALSKATEKLADVAVALAKSDETIRALAGKR